VKSFFQSINDSGDAIFDQGDVEVDQQHAEYISRKWLQKRAKSDLPSTITRGSGRVRNRLSSANSNGMVSDMVNGMVGNRGVSR
jgi:hypothetical protein